MSYGVYINEYQLSHRHIQYKLHQNELGNITLFEEIEDCSHTITGKTVHLKNLLRLKEQAEMVAVGERRKYQATNPRHVAALDFVQPQSHHGNNADEQRVPQGNWQEKHESLSKNVQYDYATSNPWYNLYGYNNDVLAYPTLQPDNIVDMGQLQEGMKGTAPLRQSSIPYGTALLDQYLHSDIDYYNIDYENLDPLSGYENEGFSVEDYIDLDKVNFGEQDGINFDSSVKQEKQDHDEAKNLEEMESMLSANMQHPNNDWAQNMNNINYNALHGTRNDPNIGELNNNLSGVFDQSGIYNLTNNVDWQSQYPGISSMQPPIVSGELVIKTEPDELVTNNCDNMYEPKSTSGLTIPEDELVEMPVSRFNELLTTLNHEQCIEAKDIRRRGKNKKAARLCRKRKLENISTLEGGKLLLKQKINKLLEENKAIISETEELKQNIDTICKMLLSGITNETASLPSDVSIFQH